MLRTVYQPARNLFAIGLYKPYNTYIMSKQHTASTARANFADIVNQAEYAGERTIVHRRKKPVAAVVPIEDLELIERYEDELDARLIKKARKEKSVAWEQVKKEIGL
jgi:prevent-host-death family protein